jgi:hypothetical protein
MKLPVRLVGAVVLMLVSQVHAQSLSQRITEVRQRQEAERRLQQEPVTQMTPMHRLVSLTIDPVVVQGAPAREAFNWFSRITDVPLVINWEQLTNQGIDPDQPIHLNLRRVPASQVLALLLAHTSTDMATLMFEATPWYIEIITRDQANARVVVQVYPIDDLLVQIPNFTSDRQSGRTSRGTDAGRGVGGLFPSSGQGSSTSGGGGFGDSADEQRPSRQERGEQIAQLIRDTIEPDIWIENGGEKSSVRYHNGRLVVTAPRYVHRQIGAPTAALAPRTPATGIRSLATPTPGTGPRGQPASAPPTSTGVSAVSTAQPDPISAIHD